MVKLVVMIAATVPLILGGCNFDGYELPGHEDVCGESPPDICVGVPLGEKVYTEHDSGIICIWVCEPAEEVEEGV